MRSKLTRIVLMLSVFATTAFAAGQGDRYTGASFATRSPVLAQHGMAATMQPLASQIAIDILKKGGTAVDAAIAANAALGLDGAGILRRGRRSLRHRVGSKDQAPATAITARAARPRGSPLPT